MIKTFINEQGFGAVEIALFSAVLGFIALGFGVITLADKARPGDKLYMLDRAFESIRNTFAFSAEKKAHLSIDLLEERYEELYSLVEDDADIFRMNTAHYEFEKSMKTVLNSVYYANDTTGVDIEDVLSDFTSQSVKKHEELEKMIPNTPERMKKILLKTESVSSQGIERAQDTLNQNENETKEKKKQKKVSNSEQAPPTHAQTILQSHLPQK